MHRPFVVISGLPGSGKTTLARRLAPALNLPLIDKDDILAGLFESNGTGDAEWRRTLSRESDKLLQRAATSSYGAVLVSFWRLARMPEVSGTPTDWIAALSDQVVTVLCFCEPETAAERFLRRTRHPGHLDSAASYAEVLASFRELASLEPIGIGQRVHVDTSLELQLDAVVREVRRALHASASGRCLTTVRSDQTMEDIIEKAERYRIRAHRKARGHFLAEGRARRLQTLLGVPVVITTTIVGTTIFATLNSAPDVKVRIATGLLSMAAAVLAALQTFFRYPEQAEKHRAAAANYYVAYRSLEVFRLRQAKADTQDRSRAIDELETILLQLNQFDKDSPDVPDKFYDQAVREQSADKEGV